MNITRHFRLLAFAFVLGIAGTATAGTPATPVSQPSTSYPAWEQLTPTQRELLIGALRERWNDNPQQRARIMHHAERWRQMTPEQRQRAQHGQRRWSRMDRDQREQMRELYERTRNLTPEQQRALREKLRNMTPEQRREWIKAQR